METTTKTQVGIVGAGPAGLMLAHLLSRAGIDSVAIDTRSRREIETTHRAGILEAGVVKTLVETGVSDRVLTDGYEHEGIDLRFAGESHPINFKKLIDATCWLYPQTDVFIDLANARDRDGGDVRFGVRDTVVSDVEGSPTISFTDAEGNDHIIECAVVAGCDGSRSVCRYLIPEERRVHHFKEYPFAWFGVLTESPFNADELIYAHSERGFALISQRTPEIQRLYFQCGVDEDVEVWSERQIWDELQARVAGNDGFQLIEGPVFERTLLRFRSFVAEPMRWANLVLAGDAAHTVPPTGAKGLNLAINDVRVLAEPLIEHLSGASETALDDYSPTVLERIWKSENFSYWMTQMLHTPDTNNTFDLKRQLGELTAITSSEAGQTYLAESYTGWPNQTLR
ncbi:MAG: 4-hydroxybenzoate 3-monooxygenase [Actinomycetales bacterium]